MINDFEQSYQDLGLIFSIKNVKTKFFQNHMETNLPINHTIGKRGHFDRFEGSKQSGTKCLFSANNRENFLLKYRKGFLFFKGFFLIFMQIQINQSYTALKNILMINDFEQSYQDLGLIFSIKNVKTKFFQNHMETNLPINHTIGKRGHFDRFEGSK